MWPVISIVLLALIPIFSYAYYWWGWNKRNLQKNNYIQQQSDHYRELYEQERQKRIESVLRNARTIKSLVEENKTYDMILNAFINKLNDAETENAELKVIRDGAFEKLKGYGGLIPLNEISKILIEESSVLNEQSLGVVNE